MFLENLVPTNNYDEPTLHSLKISAESWDYFFWGGNSAVKKPIEKKISVEGIWH